VSAKVERLKTGCPLGKCDGSGWFVESDDTARPCDCRDRRIAQARTRGVRTLIPTKYQGVSFDRPPLSDLQRDGRSLLVVQAVREFIDDLDARIADGRGLWIIGDVGTGKTSLAMLLSKTAIEAGKTVGIYSLPKLLYRIRRTFGADAAGESYMRLFERLVSLDLLQIDDLGAEKRSDWVIEQLYSIVNERYESQRAMIVTVNVESEDFEPENSRKEPDPVSACLKRLNKQIGARTVSRLIEICGYPLPLFGDDQRYRAA
jgi:DNA replication protein DnaC